MRQNRIERVCKSIYMNVSTILSLFSSENHPLTESQFNNLNHVNKKVNDHLSLELYLYVNSICHHFFQQKTYKN